VTKLSLRFDEKALKKKIAAKIGARVRTIVTDLHQQILDGTPFNTGRTLGSWVASAGTPVIYDIASQGGDYGWDSSRPRTNPLPIGTEPGRGIFERLSLQTVEKIDFENNPFRIFYIANGAALDSGADFAPDASSDLNQGPGSRAFYQEYGVIASYDMFGKTDNHFSPRGANAVQLAVEKIRVRYSR
jgi:hypothetical protein